MLQSDNLLLYLGIIFLILGVSGPGVEIYVPKTMYEDAVNLTEGSAEYEEL